MKKFYQFKNGQEMLDMLQRGRDLYNKKNGIYLFVYNEAGSICEYYLDEDEVKKLREEQKEYGEYWGAFLGWGGSIYDDPSYEDYSEDQTNNLEHCNEVFKDCIWEDVTESEDM